MNRRGFIQISSVALLPILLGIFPKPSKDRGKYSIDVKSNRSFGHLLRSLSKNDPIRERSVDYVIVGGGVAGIAAATQLSGKSFVLFEADDRLGGSSASDHWKDTVFAMGAHYELAYPESFGKEVIDLLKRMNVIRFNDYSKLYEFVDEQYVIDKAQMEQCFLKGELIDDVLSDVEGGDQFEEILMVFKGKMLLPTRLIEEEYHYLNTISFKEFIESKMTLSADLERRISYQMLDDWGGKCDEVSALAGIHYYMCRPYDEKDVPLFSPPNGNSYFIEKMVGYVDEPDAFEVNTLVRSIREVEDGVEIEVITPAREVELIRAKKVIYAGQKHALKYILRTEKPLFDNSYAPWLVLNFICRKGVDFDKWQNDVVTDNLEFLGFVNSRAQKTRSKDYDVFTAYYCLSELDREQLVKIEEEPAVFVESTIDLITDETGTNLRDYLEHVNIKLMGHAMPIPKPGYLSFKDVPSHSSNIIFAGVDTGRLPLFYEACDSGIQAGKNLLEELKNKNDEG